MRAKTQSAHSASGSDLDAERAHAVPEANQVAHRERGQHHARMLPRPSPRAQAWCHLALAAVWCSSRAASLHGWWTTIGDMGRQADAAKLLGMLTAWLTVGLLAVLVLGFGRAGWVTRSATLLALAALFGGVERVDALDLAWLGLAVPTACWTLTPELPSKTV